jgi:hypothetical protein
MKGYATFRSINVFLPHLLCVGGIISLPWFSKQLKRTYRRTTGFMASSLYFSFANQYSLGGGFLFSIMLMPKYRLSLCHTPIKLDLLSFPEIGVFACGLRDHVITRFASQNDRRCDIVCWKDAPISIFSIHYAWNPLCLVLSKVEWWRLVWHKHVFCVSPLLMKQGLLHLL